MSEVILEVRERAAVLIVGVMLIIVGVVLCGASLVSEESDGTMLSAGIAGLLAFVALGVYLILAFVNHRLKVFADGRMLYSASLGAKTEFCYADIAKIEQKMINGMLSLSFYDASGKRFGKVEDNMKDYEKLCQWLNTQKKKEEDAKAMGVQNGHEAEVTPVNGNSMGKAVRILYIVLGIIFLGLGVSCLFMLPGEEASDSESADVEWFDPYTASEEKQMVAFDMISYPFANFELSDSQALYFVFDMDMSVYIVCMDNERFETEFADIYEYTFSDSAEYGGIAEVEGYAMEIDEELREIVIEEFNYLWGSEVFTEDNVEDYIGCYYLDTTYQPENDEESLLATVLGAIFLMGLGVYALYCALKKPKKQAESKNPSENDVMMPQDTSAEGMGLTYTTENVGELPIPRNIILSLLASIVCASAGGVLWILVYKLGRITWIAGYLAVVGAIYGYCKFGRRELNALAAVWCIIVGLASVGFANYVVYAWEIVDAINASNPGRTDFWHVFIKMPQLMEQMELWSSYFADLAMGIIFALIAGVSSLFGKKKKK